MIMQELSSLALEGTTREDRFQIHKTYFETILNENSIFKNLLLDIKVGS